MSDPLDGLHPLLLTKIALVHAAMAAIQCPMHVTDGVRTVARQAALYAQGRTAPGPLVTNADGVTHLSNHQIRDGWGWAVDSAFTGPDPYLDHDPFGDAKWRAYGACAQAVGLIWGGAWTHIVDRPHIELSNLPPSKGPISV